MNVRFCFVASDTGYLLLLTFAMLFRAVTGEGEIFFRIHKSQFSKNSVENTYPPMTCETQTLLEPSKLGPVKRKGGREGKGREGKGWC